MAFGLKNTCLISITLIGGAYWYIVLISFGGKKRRRDRGSGRSAET